MNAPTGKDDRPAGSAASAGRHEAAAQAREVRLGTPECPRCHKQFTASYWSGDAMIQARCLSCDLKWPLPDVV